MKVRHADAAISILNLNINNIRSNLDKTEGRWEGVIVFENGEGTSLSRGAYGIPQLNEGGV
jgi:hypothetical protein